MGPFKTIAAMQEANERAGETFFDRVWWTRWNTRVLPVVYGGRYIIAFMSDRNDDGTRNERYIIYRAQDDGKIYWLSDSVLQGARIATYNRFDTEKEARTAARALAKLEPLVKLRALTSPEESAD